MDNLGRIYKNILLFLFELLKFFKMLDNSFEILFEIYWEYSYGFLRLMRDSVPMAFLL